MKMKYDKTIYRHTHKDLYVITTFKCNQHCSFCCFHKTKMREANPDLLLSRLRYVLMSGGPYAVKITGGEPFLKQKLMKDIIKECVKSGNVRNVGIGTNGTINPEYNYDTIGIPVDLYISRHSADKYFKNGLPIDKFIRKFSDIGLNCNLIRGGVDSASKIMEYLVWAKSQSISLVCFRELNHLTVKNVTMYPGYIREYLEYYKTHIIKIGGLIDKCQDLVHSHIVGGPYDLNINMTWDDMRVRFRCVDEKAMIKKCTSGDFIEYVIHPDGLLTGSWDREANIIMKGG